MEQKIIIVEDDRELNRGLRRALSGEGRTIFSCYNMGDARARLYDTAASLVILDIGLPDGDGRILLQEIKGRTPDLAVILLTANDTDADIVDGLEHGADDYITKPFSLKVLRARVNTQLRRVKGIDKTIYQSKRYFFDFEKMKFFIDGKEVDLNKTEQKLLNILVENRGITLRRESLIDKIWTDEAEFVEGNALSVTVKRLRDKLNAHSEIKTVYGIGYSWVEENG